MRYKRAAATLEALKPFLNDENKTPGWDSKVLSIISKYHGGTQAMLHNYVIDLSELVQRDKQ